MAFLSDVDDVIEFLLLPYKDIVSKASTAANRVGNEDPKARSMAEALSVEGQRALNHLWPLCQKGHRRHGTSFVGSVESNGMTTQICFRSSLFY